MKERKIINIPQGIYCYNSEDGGLCPYWDKDETKPYQENGYCHFLKKSDEDLDCGLIWDGVKECTIFTEVNEFNWTSGRKYREAMKKFFTRISLWGTIPNSYTFMEKIDLVLHGKLCRCKFCHKYFLTDNEATNVTQCSTCWFAKMRNRKLNSKAYNSMPDEVIKRSSEDE